MITCDYTILPMRGASEYLSGEKPQGKEHPKIYLQASGEKDNTRITSRKEKIREDRKAQIVNQNPEYKRARSAHG